MYEIPPATYLIPIQIKKSSERDELGEWMADNVREPHWIIALPGGTRMVMIGRLETGAEKKEVPLADEKPSIEIYICAFTNLSEATLAKLRWGHNG